MKRRQKQKQGEAPIDIGRVSRVTNCQSEPFLLNFCPVLTCLPNSAQLTLSTGLVKGETEHHCTMIINNVLLT